MLIDLSIRWGNERMWLYVLAISGGAALGAGALPAIKGFYCGWRDGRDLSEHASKGVRGGGLGSAEACACPQSRGMTEITTAQRPVAEHALSHQKRSCLQAATHGESQSKWQIVRKGKRKEDGLKMKF